MRNPTQPLIVGPWRKSTRYLKKKQLPMSTQKINLIVKEPCKSKTSFHRLYRHVMKGKTIVFVISCTLICLFSYHLTTNNIFTTQCFPLGSILTNTCIDFFFTQSSSTTTWWGVTRNAATHCTESTTATKSTSNDVVPPRAT